LKIHCPPSHRFLYHPSCELPATNNFFMDDAESEFKYKVKDKHLAPFLLPI
jgi:hypothetical protein